MRGVENCGTLFDFFRAAFTAVCMGQKRKRYLDSGVIVLV